MKPVGSEINPTRIPAPTITPNNFRCTAILWRNHWRYLSQLENLATLRMGLQLAFSP